MATNGDVEKGLPEDAQKDAKPGAAVVETSKGAQEVDFKTLTPEEAFEVLGVTHEGLTTAEYERRLAEYGPNKLPEGHRNAFLVYLGYMWNPLSWAMEVAAILAIILLDYPDFCLIIGLLIMNATISYREEASADKAIKALTAALAPKARAFRNGKLEQIDASGLVPGDVILMSIGNIVPADVKLMGEEGDDIPMQIDQAALTGESLPAKKFAGDVAFSGSTVKQGEKHALVYATGEKTFFGRAAALIAGTHNTANLAKIMVRIGGVCLVTIGVWCVIEMAVQFGHYKHHCSLGEEKCPTLTNMLVIIVGGIPIAMPTVLSVTLALGASKLAKEGAIVARMSAVEEMAGMDILCSDKTGTLTLNELSVDKPNVIVVPKGMSLDEALKYSALSANISSEEPIDVVMHEAHPEHATLWDSYKQVKFVPFNPTDKYTIATIVEGTGGKPYRLMKGAPQVVLKNCYNVNEIKGHIEEKITEFAGRGYRALGLAMSDGDDKGDTKWEFVCLLPLFDPPRHDTKETIERCHEKGIMVKMVTGDQLLIGKETSRQLGLGTDMYSTEALLEHVEDEKKLGELVEKADGFAEVFPEHKYEIVNILQKRNHMVGMTGDGVNDAPALKKADVGIAVDGATDAARGAADIVLTEPGLSVIVSAIIGARKIFQRMTTYSKYTVAMTFRICFTFGLLTVLYNFYFPTVLIVLLAVFNDGAMIALSKDRVIASKLPNHWDLKSIFIVGIVYGLYLTLSTWVLYYVTTHTSFFRVRLKMHDLRYKPRSYLEDFCRTKAIPLAGYTAAQARQPATVAYPDTNFAGTDGGTPDILNQCVAEQEFVRQSMTRTLLYAQVSFSGQAVVFVVRTAKHSLLTAAGGLTYIAFFLAQVAALLIAAFGFNGYATPAFIVSDCKFCRYSGGKPVKFFSGDAPQANTESVYTASVIGCTYYIIVAIIWSLIWYVGLDFIKWAMMYILNEDGTRDAVAHKKNQDRRQITRKDPNEVAVGGQTSGGYGNPLGRASVARPLVPPGEGEGGPTLARASIVSVNNSTMSPQGQGLARSSITRSSINRGAVDPQKRV